MKRILVAVDGSEAAQRAVAMAVQIAGRFAAQVELVHVMSPPPVFSEPAVIVNVADLERAQYEAAQAMLDRAQKEAAGAGVEITGRLLAGPAAEVIAEHAEQGGFDLVVLGSRGRNMITSALLGGTSHRLIHLTKKPTLIVH